MAEYGFKRDRKTKACSLLVLPIAAGTLWLDSGWARVMKPDPATQAETRAKASPPAGKPAQAKKPTAKKPAGLPVGPEARKAPVLVGRRDPFKLPGPPVTTTEGGGPPIGSLPPGTRGLVISQLRVEGIVRLDSTNTMIAVVDTNANRAYFLRENDAVYNGVVAKITPDSVTFRENALDQEGKVYVREVVKRLGQGPGA